MGDTMEKFDVKNDITKNKIITVWGNSGAGKSTFCTQMAVLLSKEYNFSVLVLDFNTLSPSLDHFLGINKEVPNPPYNIEDNKTGAISTGLSYAYDANKRGIFDSKFLKKIVCVHPDIPNLHIFTGNYLFNMFEMFDEDIFKNIIVQAKKFYDYLIIDTNSTFYIDSTYVSIKNADIVYTITGGDYTSLRDTNRSIEYLSSFVAKDKFQIIINKYTNKHLNKLSINQVLEGQNLLETIEYNQVYISSQINKKPFVLSCKSKDKRPYINLIEKIL